MAIKKNIYDQLPRCTLISQHLYNVYIDYIACIVHTCLLEMDLTYFLLQINHKFTNIYIEQNGLETSDFWLSSVVVS